MGNKKIKTGQLQAGLLKTKKLDRTITGRTIKNQKKLRQDDCSQDY
jgi:hypothetical protein